MSPSVRRRSSIPVAIDYESSNLATARVLGGVRKSWMTGSMGPQAEATRPPATVTRHTGLNPTTEETASDTAVNDVSTRKQKCDSVTASHLSPALNHDHLNREPEISIEADNGAGVVATSYEQANSLLGTATDCGERRSASAIGEAASGENVIHPETSLLAQNSLAEPLTATSMNQRPNLEADSWLFQLTEAAKPPEMQAATPGPRSPTSESSTGNDRNSYASLPLGSYIGYDFPYYAENLAKRMQLVAANSLGRSTVEAGRLQLLQDACKVQDYDYLHIHQLCCLNTKYGNFAAFRGPFNYEVTHEAGMVTLEELLAGNRNLDIDAINWFCNFPQPPSFVISEASQHQFSISRIRRLLADFADRWNMALMSYRSNPEPPSIGDIWLRLFVDSPTLQLVIFRAILRVSWGGSIGLCFCYQSCEQVFRKSQEIVRSIIDRQKLREPSQLIAAISMKTRLVFQWRLAEHTKHAAMQSRHQSSREVSHNPSNSSSSMHNVTTRPTVSPVILDTSSPTATMALPDSSYAQQMGAYSSEPLGSQSLTSTSPTRHVPQVQMNDLSPYASASSPATDQHHNHSSRTGPHAYWLQTANGGVLGRAFPMPQHQIGAESQISINSNHGHSPHIDRRSAQSKSTNQHVRPLEVMNNPQTFDVQGHRPSVGPQDNTGGGGHFFSRLNALDNSPNRFYYSPENLQQPDAFQSEGPAAGRGIPAALDSQNIAHSDWSNRSHQSFGARGGFNDMNNARPGASMISLHAGVPQRGFLSGPRVQGQSLNPHFAAQTVGPLLPADNPFISFPPSNSLWALPAVANPSMTALHQAGAREPPLSFEPSKDCRKPPRSFRFVKQVHIAESTIGRTMPYHSQTFQVQADELMMVAQDANTIRGMPVRTVSLGTLLYRIRCTKALIPDHVPTESQVVVADTHWPPSATVLLNGTALEIRRKSHHGKDLSIDVTRMIKEGANELEAAVICLEEHNDGRYAVCVEKVEVVDEELIKNYLVTMPWSQSLARIHDRVQATAEADPDVEVVDSHTVLDLTDPFTAGIFTIPVRGRDCLHHQCFDLDIFLQTRKATAPAQPCEPEEFRCPICRGDARPPSLIIDGFFLKIRAELESMGRLDVKAVVLRESAKWEIKEEKDERSSKNEEYDDMAMKSEGGAKRSSLAPEIIDLSD